MYLKKYLRAGVKCEKVRYDLFCLFLIFYTEKKVKNIINGHFKRS